MDINTLLNYFGSWTLGNLVLIDLIAVTTNAFNGAILAGRSDHRRECTAVGILLIAVIGGIGGTVIRDVLLNDLPDALTNPWDLIPGPGAAALALAVTKQMLSKDIRRLFDFMAALSLPLVCDRRHAKGV